MIKMVIKVCRICLNTSANLCIFDKQDDMQYNVKIMKCVNIVIREGDGMPDSICEECAKDLSVSYNFINNCINSDTTLRSLALDPKSNSDPNEHQFDIKVDIKTELYDEYSYNDLDTSIHSYEEENPVQIRKKKYKVLSEIACKVCGYIVSSYDALKKHLREHYKDSPYKLKEMISLHVEGQKSKIYRKGYVKKKKQKIGPIQCVVCGLMVQSKSAMDAHNRTHTGEKPFHCDVCDMRFNVKGALKKHIEIHHSERERRFICETCGCGFFRKCEIITHIRRHTDERPYACELCSKAFRQLSSLIRHKNSHTGERRHACPLCLKMFYDKSAIQKHMLVHSNEKKYSCHLCHKLVKSKSSLSTHLKLHKNEKQNICSYCGMAFSLKGNLQTHIRRKHSEKSGQCLVCMKMFPDLEEHMRKHTGEKPFACKLCDQAYATKRSLSYHVMFKHENSDKFKCSFAECTKTFPTNKLLEVHFNKEHSNHTPFVCPHCLRGFFRTSDLTRHLKGIHMDTTKIKYKTDQEIKLQH